MPPDFKNDPLKWLIVSLAILGTVAGVGWQVSDLFNGKANAQDLTDLRDDMRTIESRFVTKEDARRIETKIDTLLIRQGINPSNIKFDE